MSDESREIEYHGRTVRITGKDEPVRPRKGFFSGGPWLGPHGHGGEDADPEPELAIEVADRRYQVHRLATGALHVHAIPFRTFETLEEVAQAVVRQVELDEIDGGQEEPEQADRG
jgi:hypothetical protein